jgi:hypothetical protein
MPHEVSIRGLVIRAQVTAPPAGAARHATRGQVQRVLPSGMPGAKRIAGDTKVLTTPAPYRVVRLYHRASGRLVRETVSDVAANWAFPEVANGRGNTEYYVVALDLQPGGYNAVIADMVVPE